MHFRSSTTAVEVTILAGSPPTVRQRAQSRKVNPTDVRCVLPYHSIAVAGAFLVTAMCVRRLVLESTVELASPTTTTYQAVWSSPSLSQAAFEAILLSPPTDVTLSLQPRLTPGTYTFTLTATVLSLTGARGDSASSSVVVVVNAPPRNGYVTFEPPTGQALTTKFAFTAWDWIDDADVRPLLVLVLLCGYSARRC